MSGRRHEARESYRFAIAAAVTAVLLISPETTAAAGSGSETGSFMSPSSRCRESPIASLRVTGKDVDLIDCAATLKGKRRTEFILEVARAEAENVLLDQVHFSLEPAAYDRFVDLLDAPHPDLDAVRRVRQTPNSWE